MANYHPASAVYLRDHTLPYWQNNVDAESIFQAFAHRPERAKAWLRYRKVTEACSGFEQAVMMHGHFEGGILQNRTYHWTFTPGRYGDLAIVVPVQNDFIAMSRHDHNVWGCVTGHGKYVGNIRDRNCPLRVFKTPINWLLADCEGILPLAKSFFPSLQFAPSIVAEDYEHAWQVANAVFLNPAGVLGLDYEAAELAAFDRISFEVAI